MFGITNCGGGGTTTSAWAYIGVTYPEGSTCTATNGTTTLNAQGTSGLYVFQIPQPSSTPETWTVSCTNGTKNKSTTVSITTQYQNAVVTLTYSRLPDGYQEAEYIESSGTQYIDLGYTEGLSLLQHELTFENLSNNTAVFGSTNSSYTNVILGRTSANSPWAISYYYISTLVTGNCVKGDKVSVVVNNVNSEIVEDGVTLATITGSGGSARLTMFGTYANSGQISFASCRIYEYKQTNLYTNTVNYNLVPCYRISDSVAGMYDLANNTFLTNAGTGTFTVGPDV